MFTPRVFYFVVTTYYQILISLILIICFSKETMPDLNESDTLVTLQFLS